MGKEKFLAGKIRRLFQKQSVSVWIVAIFICILFPINILLISSTKNYMNALENQAVDSTKSLMQLYMSQLDAQCIQMERYLYTMSSENSDFIRIMRDYKDDYYNQYKLASYNVFRDFESNLAVNNMDGFYFFNAGRTKTFFTAGGSGVRGYISEFENYLKQDREGTDRWYMEVINQQQYLIREYRNDTVDYGGALLLDKFIQSLKENFELDYKEIRISTEDQIYRTEDAVEGGVLIQVPSERSSTVLEVVLDEKALFASLPFIEKSGYFLSFLCLLMIPLLFILFRWLLIRPMRAIEKALNALEQGFQDYRISAHFRTRELSRMSTSFNSMADQIRRLKIEAYEKELEKQQIQLENIRLQVHPHFLLNIFHLIFSMAQIQNYEGVQKTTLYLSTYFRNLFSKDGMHPLKKELQMVEEYLDILQVQYPDCFEVHMKLDKSLDNVKIPTLLIHSLVENISKYAISVGNIIDINISSFRKHGMAYIEVEDDGFGMAPEILKAVENGEPVIKDDGKHIGLWNARRRLNMLCSDDAKLTVESGVDQGTKITIVIPLTDEVYGEVKNEPAVC